MDSPEPRSAPYPPDTRAKGWRFEIDLERVQQSDTWALAEPEVRPWLLMIWCSAWQQTPCGSLPADERILCARIGATSKFWARHRDVLLRGWEQADDGRLYHSVIVEQVRAMLKRKEDERIRKAEYRARMEAERAKLSTSVPGMSHGTDTGQTWESGGRDDTGTGTGTGTGLNTNTLYVQSTATTNTVAPSKRKRAPRAAAPQAPQLVSVQVLIEAGVAEQHARDWLAVRQAKKAPLTVTAWEDTQREAGKAGLSTADAVREAAAHNWAGFRASYLAQPPRVNGNGHSSEPAWRTEQRELAAAYAGRSARKATKPQTEIIDVDATFLGQ